MNKTLQAALWYANLGYSVIPLSPNTKIPPKGFSVEEFRTRIALDEEIEAWFKKEPNYNLAIVTGKLSNLCVVDFDLYKPEFSIDVARKYFPDDITTPMATTPGGGKHLFFAYPQDGHVTVDSRMLPGIDFRGEGGYIVVPPSCNGESTPYQWIPGRKIGEVELAQIPSLYLHKLKNKNNIYARSENEGADTAEEHGVTKVTNGNVFSWGRRDDDFFHVAYCMFRGGAEHEYVVETIRSLAKVAPGPKFKETDVQAKIKSAKERAGRKERNLAADVRDFVMVTNGNFLVTDCYRELHIVTNEDRKAVMVALNRLSKEGLLVKEGVRNGQYRLVDQEEELIDWMSADTTPLDINYPLGIEEWVKTHKGNVIVIAGESNAGKTAFCLNIAHMNKDRFKINYMSSEMHDGAELRLRLDKFAAPIETWKGVKFQFRTDNFPDRIDPAGLNIVDYLDEGNDAEAYKMAMRIRKIADKLIRGVAVIAIQKSPGKDIGFGGAGTLNRARIYLNIQPGIMTIKKGKIWASDVNPSGRSCEFKLVGGSTFMLVPGKGWEKN
jgi:hypothetical protein